MKQSEINDKQDKADLEEDISELVVTEESWENQEDTSELSVTEESWENQIKTAEDLAIVNVKKSETIQKISWII